MLISGKRIIEDIKFQWGASQNVEHYDTNLSKIFVMY